MVLRWDLVMQFLQQELRQYVRENRTQETRLWCESVHVVELKSYFGRVLVGKDGCRDEVVEECVAKIFEAPVRKSVVDGEM